MLPHHAKKTNGESAVFFGDDYVMNSRKDDGEMDELMLHEGGHTMTGDINWSEWRDAMNSDITVISSYAFDKPEGEDFNESFTAWFVYKQYPGHEWL